MNESRPVLEDYFKLRVLLNRSNKLPDEKTEIEFSIVDDRDHRSRFVASTVGEFESHPIELCVLGFRRRWERSGFSGLHYLEEFCVDRLQYHYRQLRLRWPYNLKPEERKKLGRSVYSDLVNLRALQH